MKNILGRLVLIVALLATVTGCTTTKSYTYHVATGDSIEVELNTSDGHDIPSHLSFFTDSDEKPVFTISKDDKTLSQGITFMSIDQYNQFLDAINEDSNAKILDSGSKDGITYTFYSYNNSEFNYIIKIDGSKTGVLLGNQNSQSEAQECFDRLTFSLAE